MYRPSWDECFTNEDDDNDNKDENKNIVGSGNNINNVIRNNEKLDQWIIDTRQSCNESKNLMQSYYYIHKTSLV